MLHEPELNEVVRKGWDKNVDVDLTSKFQNYSKEMNSWGKIIRCQYRDQIDDCRRQLEMIYQSSNTNATKKFLEINKKLKQLIAQEEAYWEQRSKIFWLKEADINTKFFHSATNARRKSNLISSIKKDSSELVSSHKEICDEAVFSSIICINRKIYVMIFFQS